MSRRNGGLKMEEREVERVERMSGSVQGREMGMGVEEMWRKAVASWGSSDGYSCAYQAEEGQCSIGDAAADHLWRRCDGQ
jgi:hypothetical protein